MIRKQQIGDVWVYTYTQANVMPTSPDSASLSLPTDARKVVIDMQGVEYISSNVLGAWVTCIKQLDKVQGKLAICSCNQSIRDILEITKLDHMFNVCNTLEDALQMVN